MSQITTIKLVRVEYIPKRLEPGVLYVAEKFGAAVHLCACGCGWKVSTPLAPTEWALEETAEGPSLTPSIGNWQLPCRTHYWIRDGNIVWAEAWTPEQVAAGWEAEERRRREYYEARARKKASLPRRCWHWLKSLFGHHPRKR